MGASYYQWRAKLRHWGVQCFSSNYELYGQMSARVMATLGYEYALSENLSVLINRSLRRSTALEFCEARLR